jgi:TetR/AcrR family transcriptional regulator, transcriptional repressor for nem operon
LIDSQAQFCSILAARRLAARNRRAGLTARICKGARAIALKPDTKTKLLDAAAAQVQTRGYNGFSFHDLAAQIGLTTASIHYHFPTKAVLACALVDRYTAQFMAALGEAGADDPEVQLGRYAAAFRTTLESDRMCLCGITGAEIGLLPAPVALRVEAFFALNTQWLTEVFARHGAADADARATSYLAVLEGAMMLARVGRDIAVFDRAVAPVLTALKQR